MNDPIESLEDQYEVLLLDYKYLEAERDALAAQLEEVARRVEDFACDEDDRRVEAGWKALYKWGKKRPTTATTLARHDAALMQRLADDLESAEGPDAEAGDMWDASQCADWIREQASRQAKGGE